VRWAGRLEARDFLLRSGKNRDDYLLTRAKADPIILLVSYIDYRNPRCFLT
jgi:hypothetical protein